VATIPTLLQEVHEAWDDPARLTRLGRELNARNRLDAAERALERAVSLDPGRAETWQWLSYCHFRSLRDTKGRAVLREGIERTGSVLLRGDLSHFTDDPSEKARLEAELAASAEPAARAALLAHGLDGERPREAYEGLLALARAHPSDPVVREQLCWGLLGLKARDAVPGLDLRAVGVPLADLTIADDPERISGWWTKAQMLLAEKDWDGVLAETDLILERFPDEETAMQWRARAYAEKGDDARATHWLARAIGAKPSFVGARVDLGKLYERTGRIDLAEEVFREIPRANPSYATGPVSLALFLARRQRLDEAEQVFLAAWPRLPGSVRESVRKHPDAQALLARAAVRAAVEATG